jgi:hypothetical protein
MRLELRAAAGASVGLVLLAILPALLVAFAPVLLKLIGIVLIAALIALAVVCGKRRLVIDERGVTAKGAFGVQRLDWNEVDHYTFWSMDQTMVYAAGQGGAIGVIVVMAVVAAVRAIRKSGKTGNRRFAHGQLVLVGKAGTRLKIDARYHNVVAALDHCFAELHPRLRGTTNDFTPFALGDTELRHAKKGTLGLADIQHVSAGGSRISIKKRDKRLAWVSVPMKRIKNVMLFVELLAERGLVIKANAEVFMPPTVLDKLRAAASRQAAMPQARVVARD